MMDSHHKKDKEETKKKLLLATGQIFMTKGYHGLKASKIAYAAGVSKTLIYRYFGNVQELFKAYLAQKDFWLSMQQHVDDLKENNSYDFGKHLAQTILHNQLMYLLQNDEMQQILRWQISEPNMIARGLANTREVLGEELMSISEPYFEDSDVNFRAILAVIIPGIYYLILNAKVNGSSFCGIDINKEEDRDSVLKAISQIIDWSYQKAGQ